jgi:hypothetical protein
MTQEELDEGEVALSALPEPTLLSISAALAGAWGWKIAVPLFN